MTRWHADFSEVERHERIMLQFSGGKDSLALLDLARPYLDRVDVVWVNTGAELPEQAKRIRDIGAKLPRFHEFSGDQPGWVWANGFPVELLPLSHTAAGAGIGPLRTPRLVSYFDCCSANLWGPMIRAVEALKPTLILRGQREADTRRLRRAHHGAREGDITLWLPINRWTDDDVFEYLAERRIELPGQYAFPGAASFDCWSCTAYPEHLHARVRYLQQHHPNRAVVLLNVLRQIDQEVRNEARYLTEVVEAA